MAAGVDETRSAKADEADALSVAGRFAFERELGRGAQGRVWLVREAGEPRALKLVAAVAEEQVRAEFALLARIAHPNLASVRELVRIDDAPAELRVPRGTLGLVSAYVQGEPASELARGLTPRPALLGLALRVLDRAARALSAVHAHGFVHGDVKPANLIVGAQGASVTLIDLGLARPPGFEERPSGTPDFMAPELLRGELTPAADVYALGVTVWRLLSPASGLDSLSTANAGEVLSRAVADPEAREPLPSWVPAPLRALLVAMRNPDPALRPRSARELLAELAELASALPEALAAEFSQLELEARSARERALSVSALARVGHETAARSLAQALSSEPAIVVRGPVDSGRSRLIRDAVQALQLERARAGRPVPSYRLARSLPLRVDEGPAVWHVAGADADAISGDELQRVIAALALQDESSVLVLERTQPLAAASSGASLHEISIGPLAEPEIAELLGRALPDAAIRPELVREAAEVSGGLAARLCRSLAAGLAGGSPMTQPGQLRAQVAVAQGGVLPELPDAARRLVETLSVGGGSLAQAALAARLPDAVELAEAARLACALGVCSRGADGRLALRPDLMQGSWDALGPERRAAIARELAEALAAAPELSPGRRAASGSSVAAPELPDAAVSGARAGLTPTEAAERARVLAFLACALGELAQGDRRFASLVQRAQRSGEPALAAAIAREAEHVLAGASGHWTELAHVDALRALGQYVEALARLDAIAQRSEPPPPALGLLVARAEILRLSGDSAAAAAAAEALLASGDAPAGKQRAARVLLARLALDAGRAEQAERDAQRVWSAAGDEPEAARAAEVLALALIARDRAVEARAAVSAALGPARARGDQAAEARLCSVQGMIDRLAGDRRAAARSFGRAFTLADAAGEFHAAATFLVNLGTAQLDAGELGSALASLRDGARRLARLGRGRDVARTLYNLALARLLIGDYPGASQLATRAEASARDADDPAGLAFARVLGAEIELERGDPASARERLAEVFAEPPPWPLLARLPESERLAVLARASSVFARVPDEPAAAALLAGLERYGEAARETSAVELHLARAALSTLRADAAGALTQAEHAVQEAKQRGEFALQVASLLAAAQAAELRADPNLQRARLSELRALLDGAALGLSSADRARLREVRAYRAALAALPAQAGAGGRPGSDARFRSLTGIAKQLVAETRPRRLYERILDAAIELTHAESGFLLLRDREGVARVRAGRGEGERDREPSLISQSIVARVMATGQPLSTLDAIRDARLSGSSSVHALALRSVVVVPIRTARDVFGVIYLDDRLRPFAFGDEELALLSDLADLSAIALEASERLRRERRAIRRLQATQNELSRRVEAQAIELASLHSASERAAGWAGIVAHSQPMRECLELALRVARSDVPVLIRGESGTGKELVARAIHEHSARKGEPFVSENCGAIPETLLESTLFGHVKGAFTGADRRHIGLFEAADGGTLFLDEIGEMNPAMQVRLLRVLQDGEVRPVGGERSTRVNVRVLCATHRDIEAMVERGSFREDLYYRLAVVSLRLPPLRDRGDDIVPLIQHFLDKYAPGQKLKLDKRALERLTSMAWPGNVRQLENDVRRALALSPGDVLREEHFAALGRRTGGAEPTDLNLRRQIDELERRLIKRALDTAKGNQTRAAELLGVSRYGLQKMVKRLNV